MKNNEFYQLLANHSLITPIWEYVLSLLGEQLKEKDDKDEFLNLFAILFSLVDDGNIGMSLVEQTLLNKWGKKLNSTKVLLQEQDDFNEQSSSFTYDLYDLIRNFVVPDTDLMTLSLDDSFRNYDRLQQHELPCVYNYATDDYDDPLKFNSKILYIFDVNFEDDIYFDDIFTVEGDRDSEINRILNGIVPGEDFFIDLKRSFNDLYRDNQHFKIAGKAFVKFGLEKGDHPPKTHDNRIVAISGTVIQNTYLEIQCLYDFTQDPSDDGKITSLKIYLGITPKQFK